METGRGRVAMFTSACCLQCFGLSSREGEMRPTVQSDSDG